MYYNNGCYNCYLDRLAVHKEALYYDDKEENRLVNQTSHNLLINALLNKIIYRE